MTALLLLLLATPPMPQADEGPPALEHLDAFPGHWTALQQAERCKEHVERLRYLRLQHGDTEQFRVWIGQTQDMLHFWELLALASDTDFGEDFGRARLYDLWLFVGPQRYGRRWSPPLLTENVLPRPRKEPDCPAR